MLCAATLHEHEHELLILVRVADDAWHRRRVRDAAVDKPLGKSRARVVKSRKAQAESSRCLGD